MSLERLARPSLEAVRSLRRDGWSYDRIVAQLARDVRAPAPPRRWGSRAALGGLSL